MSRRENQTTVENRCPKRGRNEVHAEEKEKLNVSKRVKLKERKSWSLENSQFTIPDFH